jgi:hypothetical protein
MPVHIGQLISNVNIGPPTGSDGRSTASMPSLDLVLRRSSAEPGAAGQPESPVSPTDSPPSSPSADPKALADRVYRLMRDEAIIARERE